VRAPLRRQSRRSIRSVEAHKSPVFSLSQPGVFSAAVRLLLLFRRSLLQGRFHGVFDIRPIDSVLSSAPMAA